METIKSYMRHNKRLYACAIDASKAFDKVARELLWYKLIKCDKLRSEKWLIRLLINYYKQSKACVENNGMRSRIFTTTRGVKQGGSLSPFLFAIYFNEMILELVNLNIGAKLGNIIISIIVYADDIMLVASSKTELQLMLDVITEYGTKYEVKFNPNKTVYTVFNNNTYKSIWEREVDMNIDLKLSNENIKFEHKFKYLGVMIDSTLSAESHIDTRLEAYEARLKLLNKCGLYNLDCKVDYRSFLLNAYAKPILMYGLELFSLSDTQIKKIASKLNNRLKVMYNLSTKLKSTEICLAHKIIPLEDQINLTKLQLYTRLYVNIYTREVLEMVKIESNELFINDSFINDIINITKSKTSNLLELYKICGIHISEVRSRYKNLMKSNEIEAIKYLLENDGKDDLEIILLAF